MAGAGEVVIVAATLVALVVTYLVQNRKLLLSRSPTTNVSLKIESVSFLAPRAIQREARLLFLYTTLLITPNIFTCAALFLPRQGPPGLLHPDGQNRTPWVPR